MNRRRFLVATGGALCAGLAGCLDDGGDPQPELLWVELENHRRDAGYEFVVRVETDEETVFETTRELDAAGSGNAATVIENPVEQPGDYTVRVEAADSYAVVRTGPSTASDEPCLGVRAYLGASTMHAEPRAYTDCE